MSSSSTPNLLLMPEWNQEDPKHCHSSVGAYVGGSERSSSNYYCGSQTIKKRCATECSQWTLHIYREDPLKGRPPILEKLYDMPMTDRNFKVFAEPVRVQTDLVTELMVRDELQYVLNQSVA